ncbi:type III secretion system export apparatus subunit SctT [Chromobacterium sp. IIBBL 290-4]|uniref:type III secretion system export apparatus subunit SctT n=1 Tax=Chromobacterium sp. IIBBL 290-4 TaxID=2953890 RepID=UPI0020B87721|nr:type III secretion system export apparatus subunit SctT [Chromobacterium sp. IIBBL 290-4]UTH74100.1 type III secretion system export apparatus subunit SctT [Chromobacterium sp. IIBBL 290-4]
MAAGLYFDIHGWAATAALGFARVGPVFFILPFLNSNVLTGVARSAIAMLVAQGVWPHEAGAAMPVDMPPFPLLLLRETMIGLLLGVLLAWPFWVFHVLGSVIDNQRGATFSSSVDPANGVDTSELANLFNLFSAVIYLQGGGMALMLEMFAQSYRLCDPLSAGMPALQPVLGVAGRIMGKAVVLASPMIAALLLTEMTLGLLSRFAQQLNAFSVAMTVKSLVALIILLLYFEPVLSRAVGQLSVHPAALSVWLPAPS